MKNKILNINKENYRAEAAAIACTLLGESCPADQFFDKLEENLLVALILYVSLSESFQGEEFERTIKTVKDLADKLVKEETLAELDELSDNDFASQAWKIFKCTPNRQEIALGLSQRLNSIEN